ncbi:MAG: TRAP transporter fused permease subunit [Betaproteobacteria bacterium]|nr:TRAP transporter fused permease subunit [Betaproteobacteria bacterium]
MSDTDISVRAREGGPRWVVQIQVGLAALIGLAAIAWCTDLFRPLGLLIFPEQFALGMVGATLCLAYLRFPAHAQARSDQVPWYDGICSVLGLAAGMYLAVVYPKLTLRLFDNPLDALIPSMVILLLTLEGLRRTVGWPLVTVVLVALAYGLFGHLMPGAFESRQVDPARMAIYLNLDTSALVGPAMQIAVTVVLVFVFFGALLSLSGGSSFFNDLSLALFGRHRGGPAKVSVVASTLFGSVSGLAVANIMATGVVTIPAMKRAGYPPALAGAVEATASAGGQLMPPVMGAVAFLMADFLEVSYAQVCIAALLPALLYYAALFIQADLDAARFGFGRVDESLIPKIGPVLRQGIVFVIPFAVLIGLLFALNWEAERAALLACLSLITIGLFYGYGDRRLRIRDVWAAVVETGMGVIDILLVVAGAGFIMGIFQITGLGFALTAWMVDFGQGSVALLLIIAAVLSVILGMGLPTLSVYVLVAVLFAPALVEVGINPIAAHLFLLYFGMMSMITPPVALAAYFAAGLAGASPMKTGWVSMRFGWTAFVLPFLFVLSPSLLLQGDISDMLIAVPLAVAGVWFVSAAFSGYFMKALSMPARIGFAVSGFLMLIPHNVASWAWWTDVIGVVLAVLLVFDQRRNAPRL